MTDHKFEGRESSRLWKREHMTQGPSGKESYRWSSLKEMFGREWSPTDRAELSKVLEAKYPPYDLITGRNASEISKRYLLYLPINNARFCS